MEILRRYLGLIRRIVDSSFFGSFFREGRLGRGGTSNAKICTLRYRQRWTQCMDEAVTRAVVDVNQPSLAALHAAKTGKQVPVRLASNH